MAQAPALRQVPQSGVVEPDQNVDEQPAPQTLSTEMPDQTPQPQHHGRPSDDSDPVHS
ncbi:hypothetical protein [Deinococcus humi]|uniref:Uncharacterized protein n=1 Tax=Deinococcus humi TaxID=662880 RepID=A0A7W8JV13_9DEIO|nr:hypothetical protein [Deinococcus humi]MBB5363711.1 hypothetical protein [Deinococcus humi]